MRLIVLTGGIACGKSTVGEIFTKKYRIPIVDCDKIAHQQQLPGGPAYKKIIETFGKEFLNDDGTINRKKLGQLVFNDEKQRMKLNHITHPLVRNEITRQILYHYFHFEPFVLIDIPLYFEVKFQSKLYSDVITVASSEEIQIERLMKRNNFTEEEAKSRIKAQMPVEEKCKRSTIVIRNDSTREDLEKRIDEIYSHWRSLNGKGDILIDLWRIALVIPVFVLLIVYYSLKN